MASCHVDDRHDRTLRASGHLGAGVELVRERLDDARAQASACALVAVVTPPKCRRAATKVRVFQWPCGTLATSLAPRGAHPPSGAMFVFVQVASMKTRRSGLIRL